MYILTIQGEDETGAYSVSNDDGDKVLYMFQEEDDADRYAMLMEEEGYPEMNVMEVDDEILYHVCDMNNHEYTIITPNDIVIPPPIDSKNDFI